MRLSALTRAWMAPLLVAGVAHAGLALVPLEMGGQEAPARPQAVRVALQPPPEPPAPEPPEPEPPVEPPPIQEVPPEPPPETPPPPPPKAVRKPRPKPAKAPPVESVAPAEPASAAVPVEAEATPAETAEAAADPRPAPPEAPPAPAAPPEAEPSPAEPDLGPYRKGLRRALMSHRRYPRVAVEMEYEGVTWVRLSVDRAGALRGEPTVLKSSGHELLDKEALRMVRAAAPFEAMPPGVRQDKTTFDVPIRFTLER